MSIALPTYSRVLSTIWTSCASPARAPHTSWWRASRRHTDRPRMWQTPNSCWVCLRRCRTHTAAARRATLYPANWASSNWPSSISNGSGGVLRARSSPLFRALLWASAGCPCRISSRDAWDDTWPFRAGRGAMRPIGDSSGSPSRPRWVRGRWSSRRTVARWRIVRILERDELNEYISRF